MSPQVLINWEPLSPKHCVECRSARPPESEDLMGNEAVVIRTMAEPALSQRVGEE